jgi:2-polyprenyl-3-methyl-5-hydroxy-6-metoxy-1,4-benzoquinol methylase
MAKYNYDQMPGREAVVAEWQERSQRTGLASVMRASHSPEETASAADQMEEVLMDFIARNVGSLAGKNVLEIGTGIGRFTRPLAERAKSVTTVDMTASMIERAKANLNDLTNVNYVQSEIKDLTVEQNEFDLVFDVWVLMHVLDDADFQESLAVMSKSAPRVFICEYTDQGERPVGPFSLLRTADEYIEGFSLPVIAQSDFYYCGDRSDLLLFGE